MNNATYHFLAAMIRMFIWQGWKKSACLQGSENFQGAGPAIFIGNHANALGPIGCVSMLPTRLYPWMRPEMLDLRTNPDYMRADFIEKDLHLQPPLSHLVARGLSRLVVPLLNGVGCIPAFQSEYILEKRITLEQSMAHLLQGHCLLVFPEVPTWKPDPNTGMRPFSSGVLWLAVRYAQKTGNPLPFYPVAIHPAHRIRLGKAALLGEKDVASQAQKQIWIEILERSIKEIYLEMAKED